MQPADDQLRMGVYSDRQVAATDAPTHDQRAVSLDVESTLRIGAAQGTLRDKDRGTVAQSDLAAMRMTRKSDVELLTIQQHQSIRRMGQEYSNSMCVPEGQRGVGSPGPRIVDTANRNGVKGRGKREVPVDEDVHTRRLQ